jgi:hypothetical protein
VKATTISICTLADYSIGLKDRQHRIDLVLPSQVLRAKSVSADR